MVIESQSVFYEIETKQILNGVDFIAPEGAFVGIIGPNGCGKSTFLRCLYKAIKPSKGAIFLDETSVDKIKTRQMAQTIGVVTQHNDYVFDFKVEEIVRMGRTPYKKFLEGDYHKDTAIVLEALKKVDMYGFKDRSYASLSGGEKQRVVLARALAQETPFLILDEPTNHLDIKHQLSFMKTVKKLPCTVIAAVHDLNIAAAYCTHLYAMKDGVMCYSGTPSEVLTPEVIKEIYEVDAQIVHEQGIPHILYKAL
ncbi:ABC transporter ATP-binding protein [Fusibacter sp. JL298sf-3]